MQIATVNLVDVMGHHSNVTSANFVTEANAAGFTTIPSGDVQYHSVVPTSRFDPNQRSATELPEERNLEQVVPRSVSGVPRARHDDHVDSPVGKGPFKCDVCTKVFPRWPQLKRHKAEHEDDKVFRCSKCSLTFNYDSNLKVHTLLHSAEESGCLECQLCPAKFSRLASLKSHLRVHEKDDNLLCSECGDEFPTKARLEAHLGK